MGKELFPSPLTAKTVHLCLDMQCSFSPQGPWIGRAESASIPGPVLRPTTWEVRLKTWPCRAFRLTNAEQVGRCAQASCRRQNCERWERTGALLYVDSRVAAIAAHAESKEPQLGTPPRGGTGGRGPLTLRLGWGKSPGSTEITQPLSLGSGRRIRGNRFGSGMFDSHAVESAVVSPTGQLGAATRS